MNVDERFNVTLAVYDSDENIKARKSRVSQ